MSTMAAADSNRLRIVSYNILDGGLGRLDPIYETLLYLDADLVGLVEADDPAGVAYLARKLKMEHVVAESAESTHHVALLSRLPIERMVNLGVRVPMQKAAMETTVTVGGSALRLVVVHLPAHFEYEDDRLREIGPLLDMMGDEQAGKVPTLLLGDLNATAPWHPVDYAGLKPKRRERLETMGGTPRHDVVNAIAARGYVDALHHCGGGKPSPHTFTTGYPANRVDYIWASADLADRLLAAGVETGGFAPYCSDHYPIWTDLRR